MNWEDKTNSEIQSAIKEMEINHLALKQKLLSGFDVMVKLEQEYLKAKKTLNDRGVM